MVNEVHPPVRMGIWVASDSSERVDQIMTKLHGRVALFFERRHEQDSIYLESETTDCVD